MVNYKTLSIVFAVLTIIFIASTGFVAISAGTHTSVSTVIQTTTVTTGATAVQSSTQISRTQSSVQTVQTSGSSSYSVLLSYKPGLNFFLTNGTGWTVYLFTNDTKNSGTSSCYGGCATFWPAFHGTVSSLALPLGVNASAFGSISRTDGTKQLTYDG
jgi:predicted lipoprotein with Yx(FWY)xxD motif